MTTDLTAREQDQIVSLFTRLYLDLQKRGVSERTLSASLLTVMSQMYPSESASLSSEVRTQIKRQR